MSRIIVQNASKILLRAIKNSKTLKLLKFWMPKQTLRTPVVVEQNNCYLLFPSFVPI